MFEGNFENNDIAYKLLAAMGMYEGGDTAIAPIEVTGKASAEEVTEEESTEETSEETTEESTEEETTEESAEETTEEESAE